MRMFKLSLFLIWSAAIIVAGCAVKTVEPTQFSGFLNDYSALKATTSPTGKPVLRWVAPGFNPADYTHLIYNSVIFYPPPKPTPQISQSVLDEVLSYTNTQLMAAASRRMQLTDKPGPGTLIFRGAITAVSTSNEGMQIYEVLPVGMILAGGQIATGHRTQDTNVFFEGELIDAVTRQPVLRVVRKGMGKQVANSQQAVSLPMLAPVIDSLVADIGLFTVDK